jgi:hypothetical protein
MIKLRLTVLILSFFWAGYALAQEEGIPTTVPAQEIPIQIEMSPDFPGPLQSVTFTAQSYLTNVDSDLIVWYVNGIQKLKGIGEKNFTTKTGATGTTLTVTVNVSTDRGVSTAKKVIKPGEVELFWEANSYTPPFYRGKALVPLQGSVRVVAAPRVMVGGKMVAASNMSYKWSVDDKFDKAQSGYGKNIYTFNLPVTAFAPNVQVEAQTLDGSVVIKNDVIIQTVTPQVLFYEVNPLIGVRRERVLSGEEQMSDGEVHLVAFPYFFSATSLADNTLMFKWSQNNGPIEGSSAQKTFGASGSSGNSSIRVEVSKLGKILQSSSNSLNLFYGAAK